MDRWGCDLRLQLEKSWANFKRETRLSVRYAKHDALRAYCHFLKKIAYLTWSEATLANLSMTLKRKAKKVAVWLKDAQTNQARNDK